MPCFRAAFINKQFHAKEVRPTQKTSCCLHDVETARREVKGKISPRDQSQQFPGTRTMIGNWYGLARGMANSPHRHSSLSLQAVSEMLSCRSVDCYGYETTSCSPRNCLARYSLPCACQSVDTAGIRKLNSESHFQDQHRSKPPVPASFQKLKTGQVIHNNRPCSHPVSAQAGGTWSKRPTRRLGGLRHPY